MRPLCLEIPENIGLWSLSFPHKGRLQAPLRCGKLKGLLREFLKESPKIPYEIAGNGRYNARLFHGNSRDFLHERGATAPLSVYESREFPYKYR